MEERNLRKTRVSKVINNKVGRTVTVAVEDHARHPLYGKVIKQAKKFKAHDENNRCRISNRAGIMEARPLSKDRRWRLVEIVEKAR